MESVSALATGKPYKENWVRSPVLLAKPIIVIVHCAQNFKSLIRKLYTHPLRPTIKAVAEDEQLARLAEKLSDQEGVTVSPPPYQQVWRYINHISRETCGRQCPLRAQTFTERRNLVVLLRALHPLSSAHLSGGRAYT